MCFWRSFWALFWKSFSSVWGKSRKGKTHKFPCSNLVWLPVWQLCVCALKICKGNQHQASVSSVVILILSDKKISMKIKLLNSNQQLVFWVLTSVCWCYPVTTCFQAFNDAGAIFVTLKARTINKTRPCWFQKTTWVRVRLLTCKKSRHNFVILYVAVFLFCKSAQAPWKVFL